MTEREYRQSDGISRSELWRLRESPEKFLWYQEHPEESTPALVFGSMAHKLVLEPEDFDNEYAVAPECDKRTKAGKEEWQAFVDGAGDKTVVTAGDYEKAKAMADKARSIPAVMELLNGEHELPIHWTDEDTGEECKARLDCLTAKDSRPTIVDYKTAADASTEAFVRAAINYGYDFQSGMYCEAVEKKTGVKPRFIFVVQEKAAPYSVNILEADDEFILRGHDMFRELMGIYHYCKTTGNWYGYMGPDGFANELGLPAWLKAKEEEPGEAESLDDVI